MNVPRQMLESIICLEISGESIKLRICKIIKEAIENGDNEMSNTALLLNQGLQTTLPSVFTDLARHYYLPIVEDDCNLSQPKRAKYEEFSPMSPPDVNSYVVKYYFLFLILCNNKARQTILLFFILRKQLKFNSNPIYYIEVVIKRL